MNKRILIVVLFFSIMSAGIAQNFNPILVEMAADEWQTAYDDLEDIMKQRVNNVEAKFYAAICLTKLYRPEEAIKLYELASFYGQRTPMYYVFYAEALVQVGKIKDAGDMLSLADKEKIDEFDMPQYLRVQGNILAGEEYLPYPQEFVVQNFGPRVNTDGWEYSPVMTADHRSVFFTARRANSAQRADDGTAYEQVMITAMDSLDYWRKDTILGGYAEGNHHDATVQLMNNDSTIVTFKDEDLFVSDLQEDGSWGDQRGIGNINTSKWESHVFFYNNGNSMIYATAANAKNGKLDLYMAHKSASGKWQRGRAIKELNTDENDDAPYVAENGVLYFASQGHKSIGGYDIFKTTFDSTANKFTPPENLGSPINTVNNDTFFSVYGKMAYLASYRPGGFGAMDIYKVYLFNKTVVAGKFLNCDDLTPIVGAQVTVEGQEGKFSATTDANGFYKMELPIENDFVLNVDKEGNTIYNQKHYVKILFRDIDDVGRDFVVGCPDSQKPDETIIIKLKNGFDLDPSDIYVETPEIVEVEEVPEEIPAPIAVILPAKEDIRLPIVYFDFDKYDVKEEYHKRLNTVARLLMDRTDLRIQIGGHTDNFGPNAYNIALGERRYNEVYKYLVDMGVDPEQLETGTFGEETPVESNTTRNGRALNRRAILSFVD